MKGCCHSSVNLSATTILPPQARVPSTPSTLLSFIVKFVLYLSCEKNEINKNSYFEQLQFLSKLYLISQLCKLYCGYFLGDVWTKYGYFLLQIWSISLSVRYQCGDRNFSISATRRSVKNNCGVIEPLI